MNALADRYVRLVLAAGRHDPDLVDAYYGPAALKHEADEGAPAPLDTLTRQADALAADAAATPAGDGEMDRLRREYLRGQSAAVAARLRMLGGERLPFDQESSALYDAVAPTQPESSFQATLASIDTLVPGEGPLPARVEAFRRRFVIPGARLDAVFRAAIDEGRARTARRIDLPDDEAFDLEYVTGRPWSGYNWYRGGHASLIQINTELPIFIDRAVDLACHEGYPGHHAYNALLEQHLVEERGWREFTIYPLFSPQSLIAEGTANFGIEVAFPGEERVAFECERLFPLAGLDPALTPAYYALLRHLDALGYAGNEAARRYLDGHITAAQAADFLVTYTLSAPERAAQRVRFFDRYRSYVINYNLGRDLVRRHIEALGGHADRPERRWRLFAALISSPRLPSGLHGVG
jgi:hypothetical protein